MSPTLGVLLPENQGNACMITVIPNITPPSTLSADIHTGPDNHNLEAFSDQQLSPRSLLFPFFWCTVCPILAKCTVSLDHTAASCTPQHAQWQMSAPSSTPPQWYMSVVEQFAGTKMH
jgi:hypothetical protein